MKELFANLERIKKGSIDVLVDTCFFYYVFTHQHDSAFIDFCNTHIVALTSFNVEETLYHSHDVSHEFREHFRHAIKKGLRLFVVDIPVNPGNALAEKLFVEKIDNRLLQLIPDPSDAVLIAAAKIYNADVLTKDKHHLFTTKLENYLSENNLKVYNNLY